MSKKTKRQMRRTGELTRTPMATTTTSTIKTQDFAPDYSYIRHDLRRIVTIWGSFIVILIVLSIFLH